MFPEPTELLLVGCSIKLIWTPKSKSNTLTPNTNSQTYWPKGNFTRDEWNHLLCLFNISHFSSTVCSEVMSKKGRKKNQVKKESQQNQSRWRIWYHDAAKGLLMCYLLQGSERACLDCFGKPGEHQIWKSDTSELVDWAAAKNGETCDGRSLIRLLRM